MRILVLGGDGYLGWPTALRLSAHGHEVAVVDNFARRRWHLERATDSLTQILALADRLDAWREVSGREIVAPCCRSRRCPARCTTSRRCTTRTTSTSRAARGA